MKKVLIVFLISITSLVFVDFNRPVTNLYGQNIIEESASQIDYDLSNDEYGNIKNKSRPINFQPLNEVDAFYNVVIFIRFSDYSDKYGYDYDYFNHLFNSEYDISVKNYFLEVSYNQLNITSILASTESEIIYYVDDYDESYYEPYDSIKNPNGYLKDERIEREHQLLNNAIKFVNDNNLIPNDVNLDMNDDGDIDSLTFLVDANKGGWSDIIWPHKWILSSNYDYNAQKYKQDSVTINGAYAYDYIFGLIRSTNHHEFGFSIGNMVHELFHIIGAPDLYHYYDYEWIEPVGYWGVMGDHYETPTHMLGYMKYQYGNWIEDVEEITDNGRYILRPIQDNPNNLYRIPLDEDGKEYIYLEYRDQDGFYESKLENSGLLIYHVNETYQGKGNVYGYYNDSGYRNDEVFIYRPEIYDFTIPVEFSNVNYVHIDEDGDLDNAPLSQNNDFQEAGYGTNYPFFDSKGNLINVHIKNVVEEAGVVYFNVYFDQVDIVLESEYGQFSNQEVVLLDLPGTYYSAKINNVKDEWVVTYTTDDTYPTEEDKVYLGESIEITKDNPTIRVAIYEDGELRNYFEKTYQFSTQIETEHYYKTKSAEIDYWFVNFTEVTDYTVQFYGEYNIGYRQDFVNVYNGSNDKEKYVYQRLRGDTLNFSGKTMLIEYFKYPKNYNVYGFQASITVNEVLDFIDVELIGEEILTHPVNEPYNDEGVEYSLPNGYFVRVDNPVDVHQTGDYDIVYMIHNTYHQVVYTLKRQVSVVDDVPPTIKLIGDKDVSVNQFDIYLELGLSVSDNHRLSYVYFVEGEVNTSIPGEYILSYYMYDESGNKSNILYRTVTVIKPTQFRIPNLENLLDSLEYLKETQLIMTNEVFDGHSQPVAIHDITSERVCLEIENCGLNVSSKPVIDIAKVKVTIEHEKEVIKKVDKKETDSKKNMIKETT